MFPSQPLVSSAVKRRRKKNRAGRPRAARKTPLTLEQLEPRVLLDAANERYVARLYEQILQRQPETAGLAGWTALLDRGHSRQEVAAGIVGSQEHRDQQVQFFYRTLLGRLLIRYLFFHAKNRLYPERPFFIYCDECQRYLSGDVPNLLAEAQFVAVAAQLRPS